MNESNGSTKNVSVKASCLFLALSVAVVNLWMITLGANRAPAQQVTWELGSPNATTTIDGKQIPPPPPKFGGVIKPSAVDSRPWWPPPIDETFDIGLDTRTGVDDFEYRVPFEFTGTIDKLTYNIGPEQMSAEEHRAAAGMIAKARD
jgi:hypothetical protein